VRLRCRFRQVRHGCGYPRLIVECTITGAVNAVISLLDIKIRPSTISGFRSLFRLTFGYCRLRVSFNGDLNIGTFLELHLVAIFVSQ
jgi:hypothetical protein